MHLSDKLLSRSAKKEKINSLRKCEISACDTEAEVSEFTTVEASGIPSVV